MEQVPMNGATAICVILAGGKSRRMGRSKAELPLGGETFLQRLVRQYSPAFPVYVSVGRAGQYDTDDAQELVDLHPGVGPLAGLESAFRRTDAEVVFLTAVDLPFGTASLAEKLLSLRGDADACIIRRADGNVEPAFGIYSRRCLPALEDCLRENSRSLRALLDRVSVRWVEEKELPEVPLSHLLQNINTPEAYEWAASSLEPVPFRLP